MRWMTSVSSREFEREKETLFIMIGAIKGMRQREKKELTSACDEGLVLA